MKRVREENEVLWTHRFSDEFLCYHHDLKVKGYIKAEDIIWESFAKDYNLLDIRFLIKILQNYYNFYAPCVLIPTGCKKGSVPMGYLVVHFRYLIYGHSTNVVIHVGE